MAEYQIVDVFTDAPFGGNPLAVVTDATGIPEAQLQKIAREFNFSETTFVYPPEDPAHTARVRIFTPMNEVPFAGHPTVGTATVLAGMGHGPDMVLELGVGPIPVTAQSTEATFATRVPLAYGARPAAEDVAACLSLSASDVETDRHAPTVAGVGLNFAIVELASRDALERARPDTPAFEHAQETYPGPLDFAVLAYCWDGDEIRARMFAPLDGVPEDPATGSAAAALTGFLADRAGKDLALTIHQGVEMGRPSLIKTRALTEDGSPVEIQVTGQVVPIASGRLTLA